MNTLLQKYSKSLWMTEILSLVSIVVVFSLASYIVLLRFSLHDEQFSESRYHAQKSVLIQKQLLLQSDKKSRRLLQQWQQKHPRLFTAVQTPQTIDRSIQLITQVAQQTQLTVAQVTPLSVKKNNFVDLQLSGHYQQLFYFMRGIDALPQPFSINRLHITHGNVFQIRVALCE